MSKPLEFTALTTILPRLLQEVSSDFTSERLRATSKGFTTVTKTDKQIERVITETIRRHFAGDTILGEELSPHWQHPSTYLWTIDPLCGSFNFAAGIPFFATNICRFKEDKPVFALVIDYPKKTYYWSSEGNQGIFKEELPLRLPLLPEVERLVNADFGNLLYKSVRNRKSRVIAYARILQDLVNTGYELLNFYSSLSATYAALGWRTAFLIPGTNVWDLAPACYFMEKNGGLTTDFQGHPFGPQSTSAVGSLDKSVHRKLLSIIQRHWPSEKTLSHTSL